jgi:uncharacterized protein
MSMLLDLTRFRGSAERLDRRFEPAEFGPAEEEFRLVLPAHLDVEVRKDSRKFRLVGRLTTALELNCGRCLESYTTPVDSPLDLLFLPVSEQASEKDLEVSDVDVGVSYYKDDAIDLGEVIREQCYLALPMKPLCREDCAGLCPICGINRNREQCQCQPTWVDPRLEPLRRLRSQ